MYIGGSPGCSFPLQPPGPESTYPARSGWYLVLTGTQVSCNLVFPRLGIESKFLFSFFFSSASHHNMPLHILAAIPPVPLREDGPPLLSLVRGTNARYMYCVVIGSSRSTSTHYLRIRGASRPDDTRPFRIELSRHSLISFHIRASTSTMFATTAGLQHPCRNPTCEGTDD